MIELTDADLIRKAADTEDNFVERKTVRDKNGWLKTAVAFANSTPIDYPAVLFVRMNNDGTFEATSSNHDWEKQQETVTEELSRAYPPIYFVHKKLTNPSGQQCLAVIIPGSARRPHLAGKSYVREGPETVEASKPQFASLIAERTSKAYEIRKWIGKSISLHVLGISHATTSYTLIGCNHFYFTVRPASLDPRVELCSYPLNRTEISFDHHQNCLQLEVNQVSKTF